VDDGADVGDGELADGTYYLHVAWEDETGRRSPPGHFQVSINELNDPPSQPVLRMSPAAPSPADMLLCRVETPSVDPEGDVVLYTYAWYGSTDGILFTGPHRVSQTTALEDVLSSDFTVQGETWRRVVTPRDAALPGTPGVATVRIRGTSSITCAAAPPSVVLGEAVTVSGAIAGTEEKGAIVSFWTRDPAGVERSTFPAAVAIGGSAYSRTFYPDAASEGRSPWLMRARWAGDDGYRGAESEPLTFTVQKATPSLSVSLSHSSTPAPPETLTATVRLAASLPDVLAPRLAGGRWPSTCAHRRGRRKGRCGG